MSSIPLSKNIKQLRKSKGLTQKDIAAKLLINERTYSKFERGEKKTIDIKFLTSVAKALEIDVVSLIKVEKEIEAPVLPLPSKDYYLFLQILKQLKQSKYEIIREVKQLELKIDSILNKDLES